MTPSGHLYVGQQLNCWLGTDAGVLLSAATVGGTIVQLVIGRGPQFSTSSTKKEPCSFTVKVHVEIPQRAAGRAQETPIALNAFSKDTTGFPSTIMASISVEAKQLFASSEKYNQIYNIF